MKVLELFLIPLSKVSNHALVRVLVRGNTLIVMNYSSTHVTRLLIHMVPYHHQYSRNYALITVAAEIKH